jgi:hypothetical protein
MSKKKKNEIVDDWNNFIFKLLTRKRANRKITIPRDYLLALADKIHKINPTKTIVFNTLKEVYCVAVVNTYQKVIEDKKFFKDRQERDFKEYWDGLQDYIDDVIHKKNELKPKK